jgi:hypothetical protein
MWPSSGGALQRIDTSKYYTLAWMVICYMHTISLPIRINILIIFICILILMFILKKRKNKVHPITGH